jgi:hypothetical protein
MQKQQSFMRKAFVTLTLLVIFLLGACSSTQIPTASLTTADKTTASTKTSTSTPEITEAEAALPTATASATSTPDLRLKPEDWQDWPVIPELSAAMLEIYVQGQEIDRDPQVFSVIGDCQSSPTYFLSMYDEDRYTLEEGQEYLQETVDWYAGSFSHRSLTVKNGMTAPGALNPRWSDVELCEPNETPIECEIRLSNPSIILISLGTNWLPGTPYEDYVAYLDEVVQSVLDQGVIPILSTKADNAEGDDNRNLATAQVAYDLQVPLWNFWAAVKDLSNYGLDKDREDVYLNYKGWDVRNLSALELLDTIRRQLQKVEE